jgi:aldehyde dehydrogenase (NAD+)
MVSTAFATQKQYFSKHPNPPLGSRLEALSKLEKWIKAHRPQIQDAVFKDFKKPAEEMDLTEIYAVLADIHFNTKHLKAWMKPEKVGTPLTLLGTSSRILYEPKGVTLIIAPWNYPFQLMLSPLISALAAGNTAILKPSEMTPHVSALIKGMCEELFEVGQVLCIEGAIDEAKALLAQPFDHIFFTGSPAVGKHVMRAASEHLTSVTLELGGKSPTIVDQSAKIKDAAEKIAFSKFVNNGQTCIAPDYILLHRKVEEEFLDELKKAIGKMFGEDAQAVQSSASYARLVSEKHYFRVLELLEQAESLGAVKVIGGKPDVSDRFIPPTVLNQVPDAAEVWEEEIFGPVLPIRTYDNPDEVIAFINQRPKPLAQYIFSQDRNFDDYILSRTSAGGVCVNDCLIHFMNHELPFGGVNNSGIGKSHGKFGFLEFSNPKAVLKQRVGNPALKPLYPPYTNFSRKMIDFLLKYF